MAFNKYLSLFVIAIIVGSSSGRTIDSKLSSLAQLRAELPLPVAEEESADIMLNPVTREIFKRSAATAVAVFHNAEIRNYILSILKGLDTIFENAEVKSIVSKSLDNLNRMFMIPENLDLFDKLSGISETMLADDNNRNVVKNGIDLANYVFISDKFTRAMVFRAGLLADKFTNDPNLMSLTERILNVAAVFMKEKTKLASLKDLAIKVDYLLTGNGPVLDAPTTTTELPVSIPQSKATRKLRVKRN